MTQYRYRIISETTHPEATKTAKLQFLENAINKAAKKGWKLINITEGPTAVMEQKQEE